MNVVQRDRKGDEPLGAIQGRPRRVLVIEDDEELRALFADYLPFELRELPSLAQGATAQRV